MPAVPRQKQSSKPSSSGALAASPSSSSSMRGRRKKGTPLRAPAPRKPLETTEAINVSLLLRALLRSSARDTSYGNSRHESSASASAARAVDSLNHPSAATCSPSSSALVQDTERAAAVSPKGTRRRVKKERDTLPPVVPGYGRGRRSSQQPSSVGAGAGSGSGGGGGSGKSEYDELGHVNVTGLVHQHPYQQQHGQPGHLGSNGSVSPSRAARPAIKRSQSSEPHIAHANTGVSATNGTTLHSPASNKMARASSLGPAPSSLAPSSLAAHPSHSHHHHHAAAAPSPLSRSFSSFDNNPTTTEQSAYATHQRSVSAGNGGGGPSATSFASRSRKLEVPKHMQDYEITAA